MVYSVPISLVFMKKNCHIMHHVTFAADNRSFLIISSILFTDYFAIIIYAPDNL